MTTKNLRDYNRSKTYETNIGQAKTYETNSNINFHYMGHIPFGETPPNEAIDCSVLRGHLSIDEVIPLDQEPIYEYFNAKTDWQKKRIDGKILEYKTLLVEFLFNKIQFNKADLYQIEHDKFVSEVGQVSIYGTDSKKEFALAILQNHPNKPYNIEVGGSNITGKISFMTLNFEIAQLFKLKDAEAIIEKRFKGVDITDPKQVDLVPINISSLKAYIKGNENLKHRNDKIKGYHTQASDILLLSEYLDGTLPHVINESNYGRRYYKGTNLQNVSKIVRNAALGTNYEYDLNAAVYAIKLNYASEITDKKFTYTSEYIEGGGKFKDAIRKQLTLKCFDITLTDKFYDERYKIIKQALTAIGFGATKTGKGFYDKNNTWQSTSLMDIFSFTIDTTQIPYKKKVNDKYVESVQIFLEDPWVKEFLNEQNEMTDLIKNAVIDSGVITKESHAFLVDGRNAFNRNRVMAYFFQQTERQIMDTICKYVEDSGIKVLLRVHDAFHTNKPIDMREVHEMIYNQFISSNLMWLGKKVICFEETLNNGYYYDDEITAHKERIRQEEIRAKGTILKPKQYHYAPSQNENGFYDSSCNYEQTAYDPEDDPYIQSMTEEERKEHYRIVGY